MQNRKTPARRVSRRAVLAAAAASLVGTRAAEAHHGWSGFDSGQVLRLNGRIAAMTFDNPHGELRLTTAGGEWSIELAPPSRMVARGLSREMVAVGTDATVEGYPHRQTARLMRAERIVVAGKTTELR